MFRCVGWVRLGMLARQRAVRLEFTITAADNVHVHSINFSANLCQSTSLISSSMTISNFANLSARLLSMRANKFAWKCHQVHMVAFVCHWHTCRLEHSRQACRITRHSWADSSLGSIFLVYILHLQIIS